MDDIWLMFNNAWLYNRKTSRVYKYCSKLAEVFEAEIDPVMQGLGYCCGRKVSWREWRWEMEGVRGMEAGRKVRWRGWRWLVVVVVEGLEGEELVEVEEVRPHTHRRTQ